MSKEIIRFKGLSLNGDEQSAVHGELSVCAGVELHDGALRPSVLEGTMVQHEVNNVMVDSQLKVGNDVATLLYVHETASYRHFVCRLDHSLYWFTEDGMPGNNGAAIHDFGNNDEIVSISSVGNTLVVLAKTGLHYILCKGFGSGYKYLGTQFPFVGIRFRPTYNYDEAYDLSTIASDLPDVKTHTAWRQMNDDPRTYFETANDSDQCQVNVKNSQRTFVTESVWALINQANNTIAKNGHFYAPFLIRYCYRLYDGSMVMHSAPVFMNVSLPQSYRVYCANYSKHTSDQDLDTDHNVTSTTTYSRTEGELREWSDDLVPQIADNKRVTIEETGLFYTPNSVGIKYSVPVENRYKLQSLKDDWSDIVKSIDIFVSPMMTREKSGEQIKTLTVENGEIAGIREENLLYSTSVWYMHKDEPVTAANILYGYKRKNYNYNVMFDIPLMSEEDYLRKLKDCSTFYLLKSFNLETDTIKLPTLDNVESFYELEYTKDIVPNITSQELMKDDYHSHNKMLPLGDNSGMYVYNHRVNLYGMKERLFCGFSACSMVNHATHVGKVGFRYDNDYTDINDNVPLGGLQLRTIEKVVVELTVDGEKKHVENTAGYDISAYSLCNALPFYPDSNATKMTLFMSYWDEYGGEQFHKALMLKLERSNFLNGAVSSALLYKTKWEDIENLLENQPSYTVNDLILMPNKVITSEVDNPYYFPAGGRNIVGLGYIKGVAAVTRALSQGQVGDHDLVVFATDGIWVMKVSSEGTYMAIHNISREVCTNPKSICQLDQSVVFATERSLSRFVESNVVSISDMLDGPIRDWSEMFDDFFEANDMEPIRRQLETGVSAVKLFNSGSVFYDYAGSRVVVLPENPMAKPSGTVAFVFSLRDQTWSTMPIPPIMAVVPGYPSPFVQLSDGSVMVLDRTYDYDDDAGTVRGLVLTRTLTFSDTMDVIRGFEQYFDIETAPTLFLFGSNDQRTWNTIGHTSRQYYDYLPGCPFRFFRVAVYMQMKPSEEYQQLQVEVVNKYAKL